MFYMFNMTIRFSFIVMLTSALYIYRMCSLYFNCRFKVQVLLLSMFIKYLHLPNENANEWKQMLLSNFLYWVNIYDWFKMENTIQIQCNVWFYTLFMTINSLRYYIHITLFGCHLPFFFFFIFQIQYQCQ